MRLQFQNPLMFYSAQFYNYQSSLHNFILLRRPAYMYISTCRFLGYDKQNIVDSWHTGYAGYCISDMSVVCCSLHTQDTFCIHGIAAPLPSRHCYCCTHAVALVLHSIPSALHHTAPQCMHVQCMACLDRQIVNNNNKINSTLKLILCKQNYVFSFIYFGFA